MLRFIIGLTCRDDFADLAIEMVDDEHIASKLIRARDKTTNETALHIMSRKRPSDFTFNKTQGLWSKLIINNLLVYIHAISFT